MRNIVVALGAGLLIFAALYIPGLLNVGESVVPGVLGAIVAYFVLARRTFKKVEVIFTEAAAYLQQMPPKIDLAVSTLERAYAFAPQQIGVRSQIDTQLGVVHFLQKDFNKALPYLQRSLGFGYWLGGAMLAVIYYKRKDTAQMRSTFAVVLKKAKKQGLAWNLFAYLLCQVGERDEAQKLLADALKTVKDDERVQENLLALQNGKKMKLRGYREQWYQFHLESPPRDYYAQQMPPGMGKLGKVARRGRW